MHVLCVDVCVCVCVCVHTLCVARAWCVYVHTHGFCHVCVYIYMCVTDIMIMLCLLVCFVLQENAKPSICRKVVSRDNYDILNSLVQYYQMVRVQA